MHTGLGSFGNKTQIIFLPTMTFSDIVSSSIKSDILSDKNLILLSDIDSDILFGIYKF